VPYSALTPEVEVPATNESTGTPWTRTGTESKRVIARLALLFGIDSVGGGFLNSALIAFWFFRSYGTSEADLALLFFAARVLNAASHIAAAWLASRIGLLNTMVWTHLPSSLFLILAPASPSAPIAAALFLAREALVEMDVPTRQSYVMAVVQPHERTFASGVTNVTRNVAWAVGPSVAGAVMQHIALAGPLIIGGVLKIGYDLMLFASFRHVRPPEEADLKVRPTKWTASEEPREHQAGGRREDGSGGDPAKNVHRGRVDRVAHDGATRGHPHDQEEQGRRGKALHDAGED
jgi:predicted MFS family arabinose efflux permease